METADESLTVKVIGDQRAAAAAAPSASELERLMAAYLAALARMRRARAALREGLARHQATAPRSEMR